jgi:hypothetical protein
MTAGLTPRRTASATATAIAFAVAVALAVSGCGRSEPATNTLRIEIPKSSKAPSRRTARPKGVPSTIEARVGDRVIVTNHDDSLQIVAGYAVRPGKSTTIPLTRAGRFATGCSAHGKENVTLVVTER